MSAMTVYLAELCHTGQGRSPNTVPLAAGYLAAAALGRYPDLDLTIFRDPNELLAAVRRRPPAIVGFSVYSWSERLSHFCAGRVKQISPETVVVAGGASIDDVDEALLHYMETHPAYDVCVPAQGETALVAIVEHLQGNTTLRRDTPIEGCALRATDGTLLRGADIAPDLAGLPSPYLSGLLDRFLAEGYDPIIQSMRGCPYRCTFCVSGTSLWSRMKPFPLERVLAELDYVRQRARGDYLLLTDENLGILKERDVRLAEAIARSHRDHGFPKRLYFYTAKIVTEHVLRVVEVLSPIAEFGMSFQTLDPDVKKMIQRTNLSWDSFLGYVRWARERNIVSTTEMIFGFPGETAQSYLDGLERLIASGVDRIYSYNLRLLSGIDLSTETDRRKHRYRTRFRLQERTYGCYDGTVVAEAEEVVVGSESFDYDDYNRIRRYGLFLELCSGLGYFSELMQLMRRFGLPGEKLVQFLADHDFADSPRLREIVTEYAHRTDRELLDSPERCEDYVRERLAEGQPIPETKLNFVFAGRMILDPRAAAELFAAVRAFIAKHDPQGNHASFFDEYLERVLRPQLVSFRTGEQPIIEGASLLRVDRFAGEADHALEELWGDRPIRIEFELSPAAASFIRERPLEDFEDEAALQDVYMSVPRAALRRQRRAV